MKDQSVAVLTWKQRLNSQMERNPGESIVKTSDEAILGQNGLGWVRGIGFMM